ncbi:protein strawberry notch isoform X1 [Schistocerca americana]|uniref:protein strawberry notch isoform X1 n=2 Tax=Schistocerca americana TaxID=7009 RepID=UPI001F502DC3|nr:protein strawberry notch isoform X1 [Schistocerca americana]XP_047096967.1 protein strawberry notch isoform X1 [Schistocerca piceifrons]
MPRSKKAVTKKVNYKEMSDSEDNSAGSGSDFDDDEDPDKIEVPGGGKDLATAAAISTLKEEAKDSKVKAEDGIASTDAAGNQAGSKLPGGLVTKGNSSLGYEKVRVGAGPGQMPFPFASPGLFPNMGFYPGMAGIPQHAMNAALLQQSMDMGGLNAMGPMNPLTALGALGLNHMNMPLNSFMMQPNGSLLTQMMQASGMNAMHQGWAGGLPGKMVSQLWMNDESKMNALSGVHEEEEVDDEEMGVAETYADYMPSKLKLGRKHPDPVVETASLSSVEPTDVWYTVSLPDETIRSGALSALQLEAITYASQQHEHFLPDGTRAGFLIGDGAGVGKGRTIAGIIFENYLKGRKRAIWVSVSNDLKYDAERDLRDIGANKIEVHALNKFKYAKISSAVNGNVKKGVIFSTYSALIGESSQSGGKYKTRLKQLLQWCGDDFDGPVVFDECHRAKNLCPVGSSKPTKTGLTVLELQNKLPKARVVYASATGASEPRNMAYMTRLGIWGEGTPFNEFNDFISAVEKRGVGAMEIVAMDMKLRGMYIARQLSFHGVSFKVDEVSLSDEFIRVYDASVKLWVDAMRKFQEAAELVDAENRMKKTMWGQFWSSHQRFFKYLCIASKVNHAVTVAREAVKCGKCVVIGLQSTGEARTLEQLERDDGELSDFVSTAKGVLQSLVEKHFPAPDRNRIHRLLGIDPPKKEKISDNGDIDAEPGGSSGGKRKPVRQAAQRAVKRVRMSSSDESDSDMDKDSAGGGNSSGSEFKLSGSDSDGSESVSDSNQSSDFNPFYSDSDSDADPWDRRKKKGKKHKAPKKRQSTQDKINSLFSRKTHKGKRNGDASGGGGRPPPPPRDAIERACSMKEDLLRQIEELGDKLPPNTLDQLIDELGGPENVAEMTGRKGRVVQTEDGIQYESRSEVDVPLETLNLTEKQRFMDGEKDVAIISEAASSGISLQSDRRARNQRRRVHITLELPWSADRAIQQFGRTHRSNQVNAPEYIFLISDLAGERRFASIVAKRLESLGALTHGDRRATETRDLSQFNIDNKYGRSALEATMKTIMGYEPPLVPPPKDYKGDFFKDVADALVGVGLIVNSESMPGVLMLDKDYNNMSKFLNRILGMPVDLQNRLFKYFTDTLNAIVTQAKKSGRFDMGILDLGTTGEEVKRVKLYTFLRKHATGSAVTELHIVHVERGMSWEEAMEKWGELEGSHEGFYLSHQIRNNKQTAILAVAVGTPKGKKENDKKAKDQFYTIYRPNTGLQLRQETLGELEKKYKKVSTDDAQSHWTQQYDASVTTCSHAYWRGNCKNVTLGLDCEVGLRRRTYNVLAGSVLSVWTRVENVLAAKSGHNSKMQVVRLRTGEGVKIVGTLIPKSCVEALRDALSSDAEKTDEQTF